MENNYVVGGFVRDKILKTNYNDIDIIITNFYFNLVQNLLDDENKRAFLKLKKYKTFQINQK